MGRILGNHKFIFTFPHELHFFEQLWSQRDNNRILSRHEAIKLAARLVTIYKDGYLTQGDHNRYLREAKHIVNSIRLESFYSIKIFEAFLHHVATQHWEKIPCDQTPRNLFYIGEILEFFPNSRIINMIRDPRDVMLSQKKKWRVHFLGGGKYVPLREAFRSWINYHPITVSKLWNASIQVADRFSENDHAIISIYYEQLLADPEKIITKVCDFIGIPFEKNLLDVAQVGSSFVPDEPSKRGINRDRAGNWEKGGLNRSEIYLCQKINQELMKKHGYELVQIHPSILNLIYYGISFPIKLLFAIFLNLRRMKSVRDAIIRRLKLTELSDEKK